MPPAFMQWGRTFRSASGPVNPPIDTVKPLADLGWVHMRARNLLLSAAGAVGAAAVGNRLLSRRAEPLGPPLGHETGTFRWRGLDVSYTEGGDPESSDLLLVHDIHRVATSREFRRVFDRLTDEYHVLAPDLPGFGRTERPALRYSGTLYQAFLEEFINDVTDDPIGLGSGLGGAYLTAATESASLSRLLLVCPTPGAGRRNARAFGGLVRSPLIGEATFNALSSRPAIARFLRRHLVYDPEAVSPDDRSYYWETAHQPGARFAPGALYAGALSAAREIGPALADTDMPATLIWGRAARHPPLQTAREIADRGATKLVVLDQARAIPHYEQPEAFFELLTDELEISP